MSLLTTVGEFDAPELDGADVDALMERLRGALIREGAAALRRTDSSISFRGYWAGGPADFWQAHVLRQMGRSAIEVIPGSPTSVRYQFSHAPGTLFAALVVAVLVCSASVSLGRFDVCVFLFYAIGFGAAYLFGARIWSERLQYFVRRVLDLPTT